MTVKIETIEDGFGTEYVKVPLVGGNNHARYVYLTHSELADLYIALTDYYADNKEN